MPTSEDAERTGAATWYHPKNNDWQNLGHSWTTRAVCGNARVRELCNLTVQFVRWITEGFDNSNDAEFSPEAQIEVEQDRTIIPCDKNRLSARTHSAVLQKQTSNYTERILADLVQSMKDNGEEGKIQGRK
jgi:hypothetical protein